MLLNRFVLRRVVLYDRSFYDNIVMVCHNHSISGGLRTWLIRLGTALYPKFDRVIHLHASTSETLQRRPEFDESIVRSLSRTQAEVMDCVEHIAVPSNDLALRETLRALTGPLKARQNQRSEESLQEKQQSAAQVLRHRETTERPSSGDILADEER